MFEITLFATNVYTIYNIKRFEIVEALTFIGVIMPNFLSPVENYMTNSIETTPRGNTLEIPSSSNYLNLKKEHTGCFTMNDTKVVGYFSG